MFIHIKKILSFVLLMPLILGTVSACSCNNGSITDNIKKDNKEDIKEIINNRKIADLRDKTKKFEGIEKTIKTNVDEKISAWNTKIELNQSNSNYNEQILAPLLDVKEASKELFSKTNKDVFDYFNDKANKMINKINETITQENANIYQKRDIDWAVKLISRETKISVNQVNLNDLSEFLAKHTKLTVKVKRLDLEFKYNIRYDDLTQFINKTANIKIIIADDINTLSDISNVIEKKISTLVYKPLKEQYTNVYHWDANKNIALSLKGLFLNSIIYDHRREIFNYFKDLINKDESFKKLNANKKIKYQTDVHKFFKNIKDGAFLLDHNDYSHDGPLERIFSKATNNKNDNFFYEELTSLLKIPECEDNNCEINQKKDENWLKIFEGSYALVPMEIAGLPLQGKIVDENNVAITTKIWISKQTLKNNLKFYSKAFTNFFNYYQIEWNKDEIIFKINKLTIFEKLLLLLENKQKIAVSKMSLIFTDLLEDFWKDNEDTNKLLTSIGLNQSSYVEFNHHWTYEKSNQTIIYESKKEIAQIISHDKKSWFSLRYGKHYNNFDFNKVFENKKRLKIVYQNQN